MLHLEPLPPLHLYEVFVDLKKKIIRNLTVKMYYAMMGENNAGEAKTLAGSEIGYNEMLALDILEELW